MKKRLALFLMFIAQFVMAQNKVEDYLHLGSKYRFDNKDYELVWSSHPASNFYKQEYILPNENVEKYKRLILIDFIEGDLNPKDVLSSLANSLENSKKQNPVINYKVYEKNNEYMIDFIMSENSQDGKDVLILERNVYRYFRINTLKRKGILLFGVSDRAYTKKEMDNMFSVLKNNKLEFASRLDLGQLQSQLNQVRSQLKKVIVGQERMIDYLLVALLSNGHVLLEGVPGIAKTITVKLLSKALDIGFSRIQFTPDLMPSDILGTSVFNMKTSEFEFKKGPIFSNFILIDEINRSPAKTQAALFEVMEERQITMDGTRYAMELPFLVVATQNPIEQEGTYRLPEAQLDRFLFKINVGYPNLEQEITIIQNQHQDKSSDKTVAINTVISGEQLKRFQNLVKEIIVEPHLIEYIAKLVINTRENQFLYLGASPRASLALLTASKAFAAIRGRDFVTPEDIKEASYAVLRHRVMVSPEREMEGLTTDEIIRQILENIEIPR